MELLIKKDMRAPLKMKRSAISPERRRDAQASLLSSLCPLLKQFKTILSFYNLPDEIDTLPLNTFLAEEGRLLLPKISEDSLLIYRVQNPHCDLLFHKWGLQEPDPSKCPQVTLGTIDCVLVPGLGFDKDRQRIGYGKGHYDRLLAQFRQLAVPPITIGLGFKEQFCEGGLPCEPHDIALNRVRLF